VQEGPLTHDEINHSIAAASKTIIFARQNRLRDGVMLPDQTLRRFHAVRQLPEYFLDALLARDSSVTLVTGQGMLAFQNVRNWRRTCGTDTSHDLSTRKSPRDRLQQWLRLLVDR
jgi:hypothetical protein